MTGGHVWFDFPNMMQRLDSPSFDGTLSRIDNLLANVSLIVHTSQWAPPTCKTCFLDDSVYPMVIPPICSFQGEETIRGVPCDIWHGVMGWEPATTEMTFWVAQSTPHSIYRAMFLNDFAGFKHKLTMDFSNFVVGPPSSEIWNPNATCGDPKCQVPLELALLVDGSGSISASDFSLMKQFAVKVTKQFSLGKNDVRIGVVQFSDRAVVHQQLSDDATQVIKSIEGMNQIRSGTNMDNGLIAVRDMIKSQGRMGVISSVIMFTDGVPDAGTDPVAVADTLKRAGIEVYTVGVGSGVNPGLLKKIASVPPETHAFLADSFAKLQELLTALMTVTCKGDKCAHEP